MFIVNLRGSISPDDCVYSILISNDYSFYLDVKVGNTKFSNMVPELILLLILVSRLLLPNTTATHRDEYLENQSRPFSHGYDWNGCYYCAEGGD